MSAFEICLGVYIGGAILFGVLSVKAEEEFNEVAVILTVAWPVTVLAIGAAFFQEWRESKRKNRRRSRT